MPEHMPIYARRMPLSPKSQFFILFWRLHYIGDTVKMSLPRSIIGRLVLYDKNQTALDKRRSTVTVQTDRQTDKQTGFPSVDKPWLKYYKNGVFEKALSTPTDKTLYRFYVENVFTDPDFPILKYFNTVLTTRQFLGLIETWARAFRAAGVIEDEMVPVYGTWSPEISAVLFALNAIGAHPYFEKLDITEDALRTETAGAKIAVVFEPLWNNVAKAVFNDDRFEKVFVVGLADSMSFPLKQLLVVKNKSSNRHFSNKDKYIFKNQVKKLASEYVDPFEVPFQKGRIAVITTSSGTTSSVVKGIMDTNEGALANIIGTAYSEPGFIAGKECLITLPPTASTAINCFFLLPLYMGMTVRIDPRADEENWPYLILRYKPSLTATTGSLWYSFFRWIESRKMQGKKIDLSFLDTFILGGSGVTPEQRDYINTMAKDCHVRSSMDSGYGCSEFFGVITVDKHEIDYESQSEDVIDVGIPIPGAVVSAFDQEGNEVPYSHRGELWAKGPSIMHGYFGKPELTKTAFADDWLKTGDIGFVDENGYIYCCGRMKSSVAVNGKSVFLFDVANALRQRLELEDCMVEVKKLIDGKQSIDIYYVQKPQVHREKKVIVTAMNEITQSMDIAVDGYMEFPEAFPISPTTLKPKTRYSNGFYNYSQSGELYEIGYLPTSEEDVWSVERSPAVSTSE